MADLNALTTSPWIVRSPLRDVALRVTCTGQTDDDWYKIEVLPFQETDEPGTKAYPLRVDRLLRNVGEVRFSGDGLTVVALEFDGNLVVWKRSSSGRFDDPGQLLHVGNPIHGLEIDPSGGRLSVKVHTHGRQAWVRDLRRGVFLPEGPA